MNNTTGEIRSNSWLVPICGVVGIAIVLFIAGTWQGIGLRPDSVVYLGLWNEGLAQAPLYTLLIDIGAATGLDVEQVAWTLNLVLLIATIVLLYSELMRNGVSAGLAFVGLVVIIFLPQYMYVHVTVFSEPLYILLFLSSMVLTARAIENQSYWLCALAGVLAGLSILTRFAGVPIIGGSGLAILLYGTAPFGRRLMQSVVFGGVASAIFVGWFLMNQLSGGSGVGRSFAFLGEPNWATFVRGMTTANAFFLPSALPMFLRYILFAGLIGTFLWLAFLVLKPHHSEREEKTPALARVAILYVLTYIPFLVLTLYIEYGLGVLSRYLVPSYMAGCMALLLLYGRTNSRNEHPIGNRLAIAVICLLLLANLARGGYQTYNLATEGNFYTAADWTESATLQRVSDIGPDVKIYTNGPDPIRVLLRRKAYFWPRYYDPRTGQEHPDHPFKPEMEKVAEEVAAGTAVVVGFDAITWREYLIEEDKLVENLGLTVIDTEDDGRIYGSESTKAPGSSS